MSKTVYRVAEEFNISKEKVIELVKQFFCRDVVNISVLTDQEINAIRKIFDGKSSVLSDLRLNQVEKRDFRMLHNEDSFDYEEEIESIFRDKKKKIFIDTCSLMSPQIETFFAKAVRFVELYENKIIIPQKCVEELDKHQYSDIDEKAHSAHHALHLIQKLKDKYIRIMGEKNDNFADNVFLTVFEKFRMKYSLLLITQDKNLAKEILLKNQSVASRGLPIEVRLINESNGKLQVFNREIYKNDIFKICTSVTEIENKQLNVHYIPKINEKVYTSKGKSYILERKVGEGGEGVIYDVGNGKVAKIYFENKNDLYRLEKLKLMTSKHIEYDGICFPQEILYNRDNEFVGYIMPLAKGKKLLTTIYSKKDLIDNFPNWKKVDLVDLCITILEKINYLHSCNILLGDINENNILIVSPSEVYFVDTDSYQIEGFPCPVGTPHYLAPELQGKSLSDILRTKGNENFAIATLLFMILHCGKAPYAQKYSESSMEENIKNMQFPYSCKKKYTGREPNGNYPNMWSHLASYVQELFFYTFQKGEKYAVEEQRVNCKTWLRYLRQYSDGLYDGSIEKSDSMSIEIFPNRPRVSHTCRVCGYEARELFDGLCIRCSDNNKVCVTRICIECGEKYNLTYGQVLFYAEKGLNLPRRCKNCRKNRKNNNG